MYKKKIIFLIAGFISLLVFEKVNAQCPTSTEFFYQTEIDDFATLYPNCTELAGGLYISASGQPSIYGINNLDGLSNLTSVGGDFTINSTYITNLNGLSNLISVGGNFSVFSNSSLTNIEGLNNLTSVGGDLSFFSSALTDFNGLSNLTSIGEHFSIHSNTALTSFDGLSNLTSIGGDFIVSFNNALTSLDGLNNLTTVGGILVINSNSNLNNLNGLSSLTNIGKHLSLSHNNNALTNLNGLNSLTSIGGLQVFQSFITDFNGLNNLTSIGGHIFLSLNSYLTSLDGLDNLTSVGGHIEVQYNSVLTNLNGLSNVTSINGGLAVTHNNILDDISGLQNIAPNSILGDELGLFIKNNPLLSVCNLDNICEYLSDENNLRDIEGNAQNCVSAEVIISTCVYFEIIASSTVGGTVAVEGTNKYGNVITLTAIAEDGYEFVNWTENGTEVSTNSIYSFIVEEDRNLVANFTETSSVGDWKAEHINLYPNPVKNILYFEKEVQKATITDLTGKVFSIQNNSSQVDMSNFQNGVYLITIEQENGLRETRKVIKQ